MGEMIMFPSIMYIYAFSPSMPVWVILCIELILMLIAPFSSKQKLQHEVSSCLWPEGKSSLQQ